MGRQDGRLAPIRSVVVVTNGRGSELKANALARALVGG